MGISDFSTAKTGMALQIQSISWDESVDKIKVFVQNVGDRDLTLNAVYVNYELDDSATINPVDLAQTKISEITLSGTYTSAPLQIRVKIVTVEGAFSEVLKTFD